MATLAPPPASANAASKSPPTQAWLWRVQGFMSAYLPLLLMALLAGGTWWLVKNTPLADEAVPAQAPRHEPDYQMQGFELERVGTDGRLRVRVGGAEMRHYPDTDTVEIDGVRVRAFGLDGRLTVATARRAISNNDGSDMQLLGDVLVQRFDVDAQGAPVAQPNLTVRGEFLQVLANAEKMRSHLPVTINYGVGSELHAQSFEFDNLHGQLTFRGPVKLHSESPRARPGSGKK